MRLKILFFIVLFCLVPHLIADSFEEANKLLQQDNYAFAYKLYAQSVQDDPSHPEKDKAYFMMAYCQYKMKNYTAAETLLNDLLRQFSISIYRAQALFLQADIDLAKNNRVAALRKYFKAIKKYPKHPEAFEARLKIADIYLDLDRSEEAEKIYLDELKKIPPVNDTMRLYFALGKLYERRNGNINLNQALAYYKKTAMIVSTNIQLIAIAQYRTAEIYLQSQQYPEALEKYDQLSKNFPEYVEKDDLTYKTAYCLQMIGKFDESLIRYRSLIPANPSKKAQIGLRISEIMLLKGETNLSMRQLDTIESIPGVEELVLQSVLEKKAYILYSSSRLTNAISVLSHVTNKSFKLLLSAQIYYQQNLLGQALTNLLAYESQFPDKENMDRVLFLTAQIFYNQHQYESALPRLKGIYEKYPSSSYWASAIYYMALCQKELGKLDDALVLFNRLTELTSDQDMKADSRYEIARIYFAKQRYKESAELYALLAKERPDRRGIFLFNAGESYFHLGYTNIALDHFKQSLTDPTSIPVFDKIYSHIRDIYFFQKKYINLVDLTRFALTNGKISDLLITTLLTTEFEQEMRTDYLKDHFKYNEHISDLASHIRIQMLYAKFLFNNQLFQNAISVYTELLSETNHPGIDIYYDVGMCYINLDDIVHAEGYFSRVLDSVQASDNMKIDIYSQMALYYYKLKKFSKARFYFSDMNMNFPGEPNHIQTLYWIGMCYYNETQYTNALLFFDKASKEGASNSIMDQLLFRTADIYFEMENYPQAALTYQQLIRKFPASGAIIPAQLKLAQCYEKVNNPVEAQKIHAQVNATNISVHSALFPSYYQLALLYKNQNDPQKALEILSKLENENYQLSDIIYQKATILRSQGSYSNSLNEYLKIVVNKYENFIPEAMYYIGYCYEQLGEISKASDYYRRTIVNFPDTAWGSMATVKSRKYNQKR